MAEFDHKEIGEVCGMVRREDGTMHYKLFNGIHQERPTFTYAPVPLAFRSGRRRSEGWPEKDANGMPFGSQYVR